MASSRLFNVIATAAVLVSAPLAALAAASSPVVATDDGPVRGTTVGQMQAFLGLPYAAPPVGDLRWRPPQPNAGWQGVRDASKFASHCPQLGTPYGLPSTTEDCL